MISFQRLALFLAALAALLMVAIFGPAMAGASTRILYDQTTGTPGGFVPSEYRVKSSGTYECNAPTSIWQDYCYAADDFMVPPGPAWYVQSVHVDGQGGAGDAFVWTILPSEVLPASASSNLDGSGYIGSNNPFGSPLSGVNNFDIPAYIGQPSTGFPLLPGHYWLKVYASNYKLINNPVAWSTPSSWAWQTQSPQTGYEAAWENDDCSGTGFVWKHLSECGKTGPDLRFRLSGQLMDSAFGSFQLGKPKRIPSGGLEFVATAPGPGTITIRKVAGKGKIETHVSKLRGNKDFSVFGGVLKIKPAGKTKAALRLGKKFKMRVAITYTRVTSSEHPVSAPPNTQTLNVVLKRPTSGTKH